MIMYFYQTNEFLQEHIKPVKGRYQLYMILSYTHRTFFKGAHYVPYSNTCSLFGDGVHFFHILPKFNIHLGKLHILPNT